MNFEQDLCLSKRLKINEKSLQDGILYDYSFNDMFMRDTKQRQQAYYYSINTEQASERFLHGPPSPVGSKHSLDLTSDAYVVIPNVVDRNTMTVKFWMFIKDANSDNTWSSLFFNTDSNNDRYVEIKLWPITNRLQFILKTVSSSETIDTNASLLTRRWYSISYTITNDKNRIDIYINGIHDGQSGVLKTNRETTKVTFNYVFGKSPQLKGVNAYIDKVQIYSRELQPSELITGYAFLQSLKDPVIVHGCQSCTYSEAELVCKNIDTVGIRTKDEADKSDYAICSLQDLYLSEGWNFARAMGWFAPFSKNDDSGTIWIREIDEKSSKSDKLLKKITLCCRKVV